MNKLKSTLIWTALVLGASQAHAVATTDTVEAPTGFFTPDASLTTSSPYYRGKGQDWGWTHGAIAGPFSDAHLNISAFDVDKSSGEIDNIYAMDDGVWTLLGSLDGNNNIYAFTDFTLGSNFYNDIAAGLQVKIEIDTATNGSWLVSLAKSSLSVDGGRLPPPDPGVPAIPEPETYALMLAGLAAVGAVVKRRKIG